MMACDEVGIFSCAVKQKKNILLNVASDVPFYLILGNRFVVV
jgi:hypothetical protein